MIKKLPQKIIMVIVVVVTPLVAFLYLKSKEDDTRFTLRKYGPKEAITTERNGETVVDTEFHKVPPFSFIGQNANIVTNSDLENHVYVADFFFTNCMGPCLKMTNQLTRVQEAFATNEHVKIISHTVDPKRDSVAALKEYAESYGVDDEKWHLITGAKKEIYDLARYGYFVSAGDGDGSDMDFIHTEKFVLVDKEGIIRGYYNGTNTNDVDSLISDIKFLLWEYDQLKEKKPESLY